MVLTCDPDLATQNITPPGPRDWLKDVDGNQIIWIRMNSRLVFKQQGKIATLYFWSCSHEYVSVKWLAASSPQGNMSVHKKRAQWGGKKNRAKSWKDPGFLWHCLRLCTQPWLRYTHGLFSYMGKYNTILFKPAGLIFCHLNKKVHNSYNTLPMDHKMLPQAEGPLFQDLQELLFNAQSLTLTRARLLLNWSVGGFSAAGPLCGAKELMGFWLPEHLCWNSLGNFVLWNSQQLGIPVGWWLGAWRAPCWMKKCVWSQLGRAVGGSWLVLPNSHCALREAASTTVYCWLLLSP